MAPLDLDAGEITDKGYINQRQVLAGRAALVDLLYADPPRPAWSAPDRRSSRGSGPELAADPDLVE